MEREKIWQLSMHGKLGGRVAALLLNLQTSETRFLFKKKKIKSRWMTSGRIFFLLTNANCTSSCKKKKIKMGRSWWSWSLLYMRESGGKNPEKINFTFSLSGWAMPFQRPGPRLWEVLTLSPRPRSHRRRFPGCSEGKHSLNSSSVRPYLCLGSARCRFTALLSNCRGQG